MLVAGIYSFPAGSQDGWRRRRPPRSAAGYKPAATAATAGQRSFTIDCAVHTHSFYYCAVVVNGAFLSFRYRNNNGPIHELAVAVARLPVAHAGP